MRRIKSLQKAPFPQPDVVTKAVPVPTDGWDAISPLADMDPKRAPILQNWVPRPGWVELRQGYTIYATTGTGDPVETIAVLRQPTSQHMLAATDLKWYNVSSTPTVVATGFSNNRWQYTNFTPPNGTTVIQLVNGTDSLQQYNGTSWIAPTITGFPNSWATSNIVNIYANKQRLWYVMGNSTIVSFMPVGNISGAIAGYQDFGTLFNKGGFLQAVTDWTIDGGEGPSAYTAFISSEGQIALYQGIDPTNTSLWAFVGVFDLAKPIGYRCATKIGSDVALITYQGLIPLSQALPYDPSADRSAALTARIQNAMNLAVQSYAGNFGWQWITFPQQTLGFLNIPISTNSAQTQYVQNMLTGAWCSFTNWNANCWELFNQNLYFGDNTGNVNQVYSGVSTDNGAAIPADMQCAFNWFDDPGRLKRMTMIQPIITASSGLAPNIAVDVDFSNTAPTTMAQNVTVGALWDASTSLWDTTVWAGAGNQQLTQWYSVEAIGKALAIRVGVNVVPSSGVVVLQMNAFNAIMELGAFI
jgi:hypothetical protein